MADHEARKMAACSQWPSRVVRPMALRVSLPCVTISQAPHHNSQQLRFSTSTQRIILAVRQVRAKDLRRCPPWTVLSASRIILESSGTVSAVRSLADLVSSTTFFYLRSYLSFIFQIPTFPCLYSLQYLRYYQQMSINHIVTRSLYPMLLWKIQIS